jgi:signal transduction histidine kinase/HAMP domain-containing protein
LGLRRRILLLVLILALAPSLVILFVGTAFALATLRTRERERAEERLITLSDRLSDEIQADSQRLREMSRLDPWERLRRAERVAQPLFILREGVIASIPGDEHPTPDLRSLLDRPLPPADSPFLRHGTDHSLWLFAPIPATNPQEWLVAPTIPDLRQRIEQSFRDLDAPYLLLSSRAGIVAPSGLQDDVQRLLFTHPELFESLRGVVESGESDIVFPFTRVNSVSTLTRLGGQEEIIVLLQRVDLRPATDALLYHFWQLILVGLVFIAFITAFGVWLSRRMVGPIIQLRSGFQRLEQGDLDYRIELRTGDELEDLARSMDSMARTLARTYQNLADKLLELDEKARQLAITHEISLAVARSLEMDGLFREVIESVRQLVPADRILLGLLNESKDGLERVYAMPSSGWDFGGAPVPPLDGSYMAEVLSTKHVGVFLLQAGGNHPEERALADSGAVALCALPLVSQSGRIGVLLLADKDPVAFRPQELEILDRLAPSLATALEHSRLYARQAAFATKLEAEIAARTAELKQAQDHLLQVEKLAASGELAANVAHEINNPLSIIKNYIKLLEGNLLHPQRDTADSEIIREGVTIIGEEIDRIARIVEQLKKVSAPASPAIAPVQLNHELEMLMQLFQQTFQEKKLEVRVQLDPTLGTVYTCSDHLHQVLINLLRNACDATPTGGTITLESRAACPDALHYSIAVRDTGTGIPRENLKKIFDPFFTTKTHGKGTGLGLSVSFGLVRQMGGRIDVRSEVNRGTEMRVVLPTRPPGAKEAEEQPLVRRVGGKIMIG